MNYLQIIQVIFHKDYISVQWISQDIVQTAKVIWSCKQIFKIKDSILSYGHFLWLVGSYWVI